MGCDIHSFAEVRDKSGMPWKRVESKIFSGGWSAGKKSDEPFGNRSYAVFGFLANVRNSSESEFLQEYRGLPDDSEYLNYMEHYALEQHKKTGSPIPIPIVATNRRHIEEHGDYHSLGHVYLYELLAFDYDKKFLNKRSGEEGEVIYREFLPDDFFKDIEALKSLGAPEDVRVVFWFDS